MRTRRAFTLIELLVVIAIIAILAAILFPVFAQAKEQAKKSGSVSNLKQITLAEIMYAGDFDDNLVPVGVWNSNDEDAWTSAGGWASWALLVDPYQKTVDINASPLSNVMINSGENRRVAGTRFMEYGYNYTYLSPHFCCDWPSPITTIPQTSVAAPANTIKFTERTNRMNLPIYWYGAGIGWMIMGTSEAPDCATVPTHWCSSGWGFDSFWAGIVPTETEGKETGLNAFRSANTVPTAFVDGHVEVVTINELAKGTNYTPDTPTGDIVNEDPAEYMWDTAE